MNHGITRFDWMILHNVMNLTCAVPSHYPLATARENFRHIRKTLSENMQDPPTGGNHFKGTEMLPS